MANLYLSQQLKAARKRAGLTQRDVYQWLGIRQSTFSAWETGQSEPSVGVFLQLCQRYGIKDIMSFFLPDGKEASRQESMDPAWVRKFSALSPHGREAVLNCLDFEYRSSKKRIPFPTQTRTLPLYHQAATAGRGSYLDDSSAELCTLEAPAEADFALRILGDSMEPLLDDGQIVFVRQMQELAKGEIGIFIVNGESYCKMWDGHHTPPRLLSVNPAYPPMVLSEADHLRICGKVLL